MYRLIKVRVRASASGKTSGQDFDGAQCAGFAIDSRIGAVDVAPDLRCRECNKQAE
jgi:hypothetical protein